MSNSNIYQITEMNVDKSQRCRIPREFWTAEMWGLDREKKREREKRRKRHYQMAFGNLKKALSVDQTRTCQVDVLRLAQEKILSLTEQYLALKEKNVLTLEPLTAPDNDGPSPKRRKLETVPYEIEDLPPPMSPFPLEDNSNFRL